jgi:hypothetical protein
MRSLLSSLILILLGCSLSSTVSCSQFGASWNVTVQLLNLNYFDVNAIDYLYIAGVSDNFTGVELPDGINTLNIINWDPAVDHSPMIGSFLANFPDKKLIFTFEIAPYTNISTAAQRQSLLDVFVNESSRYGDPRTPNPILLINFGLNLNDPLNGLMQQFALVDTTIPAIQNCFIFINDAIGQARTTWYQGLFGTILRDLDLDTMRLYAQPNLYQPNFFGFTYPNHTSFDPFPQNGAKPTAIIPDPSTWPTGLPYCDELTSTGMGQNDTNQYNNTDFSSTFTQSNDTQSTSGASNDQSSTLFGSQIIYANTGLHTITGDAQSIGSLSGQNHRVSSAGTTTFNIFTLIISAIMIFFNLL